MGRSIPACAGEPQLARRRQADGQVYPRVCGGTHPAHHPASDGHGLSPRVRGNPAGMGFDAVPARSIPACAGEPYEPDNDQMANLVYPRVCGGTAKVISPYSCPHGLSPRVRGNRKGDFAVFLPPWSIPACAGEPCSVSDTTGQRRVYPRVCGGTITRRPRPTRCWGLSPRVRGNHGVRREPNGACGSIPACAGEPAIACPQRRIRTVYPRVCGGTTWRHHRSQRRRGLSPRVRGNL